MVNLQVNYKAFSRCVRIVFEGCWTGFGIPKRSNQLLVPQNPRDWFGSGPLQRIRLMIVRLSGPLVRWSAGPPVRRFAGPRVRWSAGRWSAGSPVRRFAGPLVRRSACPLVRRSAGPPSAGPLVRRSAGPLVRWSAVRCSPPLMDALVQWSGLRFRWSINWTWKDFFVLQTATLGSV